MAASGRVGIQLDIEADVGSANAHVDSTTDVVNDLNGAAAQVNQTFNTTNVTINQLGNNSQQAASRLSKLKGLLGALSIGYITNEIFKINVEMQSLRTSLESAVGSAEKARIAFEYIQKFASNTPYSVQEVTEAFIKLKNLGLSPSIEALTAYGNVAGAMGKSLDQFIEAVADAATGEFERLKEFGIKSSNQGDKIVFTFRGVKTEIANESQAIQGYLKGLGDVEFAGGMEKQSQTMRGALSNLGDAWDGFYDHLLNTTNENLIGKFIAGAAEKLQDFDVWLNGAQTTTQKIEEIQQKILDSQEKINAHENNNWFTAFIDDLYGFDVNKELNKQDRLRKALKELEEQAEKEAKAFKDMTKAAAGDAAVDKKELELRGKIRKEMYDRDIQQIKESEAEKIRAIQNSGATQQQIDKQIFSEKLQTNAKLIALVKKQLTAELLDMQEHLATKKNYSKEELLAKKATLIDIEKAYRQSIEQLTALEQNHRDKVIAIDKEIQDLKKASVDGEREIARAGMTEAQVAADKQLELEQKTRRIRVLLNKEQYEQAAELGKELNALALEQAKTAAAAGKASSNYRAVSLAQYEYQKVVNLTTKALEGQKKEEQEKADQAKFEAELQRKTYEQLGGQIKTLNETLTKGGQMKVVVDTAAVEELHRKIDDLPKELTIYVTYKENGTPVYSDRPPVSAFADGGVMTSNGPLPLKKYADGGIANSPQLALFGEGSSPEAFVPLPDGRSIPVSFGGGFVEALNNRLNVAQFNTAASPSSGQAIDLNMDFGNGMKLASQAKEDAFAAFYNAYQRKKRVSAG